MDTVKLLREALELARARAERLPDGDLKDDIKFDIWAILQKLETQSLSAQPCPTRSVKFHLTGL